MNNYTKCPECGGKMLQTAASDDCKECGYYFYYGGSARKKLQIVFLLAAIMLAGCYQPHKTVYKQPLVRGHNERWVKAGEKELCDEPCKMTLVSDPKNYKGDTLWLYSKRN